MRKNKTTEELRKELAAIRARNNAQSERMKVNTALKKEKSRSFNQSRTGRVVSYAQKKLKEAEERSKKKPLQKTSKKSNNNFFDFDTGF